MTLVARRLAYAAAILVFCVTAPLVVAMTLGFRWAGWPPGFIRTGIIVVTSQPKAELLIDGRARGTSPRRVAGLSPGVYTVRLERAGYASWQQLINLAPNTARVIGPVTLFPSQFGITEIQSGLTRILTDRDQAVIVDVRANGSTWQVGQVWPTNQTVEMALPAEPHSLIRSPHGQVWVFPTAGQTEVRLPAKPDAAWTIQPATQLAWTQASDQVWFGLRNGQLVRFDVLTQTEELIGPAVSFSVSGETLWFTRSAAGTELWRQPALGQNPAELIAGAAGTWELQAGPDDQLWWRNPATREAEWLTFNTLTTALGREPFGRVDRMFWTTNQPPVWVDGVNVITWVNDQPVLLERTPNDYQAVRWLEAPHLLLSVEPAQIAIQSVSLRQGHATILTAPLTPDQSVVMLEPDQHRLIVLDQKRQALQLYRWDEPDRSTSQ